MLDYADLPRFIADARAIDWAVHAPRRNLHLGAWQEDWSDHLAILRSFVEDGAYGLDPQDMDSPMLQDACMQWENAAQTASTLLHQALDHGLPAHALQPLYVQVVAVWREYAWMLQQAGNAGAGTPGQAIRTDTSDYQFALQLLALGVLLDAQDEIPSVVEHLLVFRTDRLLDYLSAAAIDLQEASDDCLHPQPFAGLHDFLDQYGDILPDPLLPYLEHHYSRFFALTPQAQKKQPRLTGPQAWGWWALEVGALVVLYDLDDSALRDVPHYPADLVDYALGVRD